MTSWSDQDLRRMENHGISHLEADRQLDLLAFPPIPPQLDRPATLGDGICKLTLDEQEECSSLFEPERLAGHFEKFVPASGAASRMFFDLTKALNETPLRREDLERQSEEGKLEAKKLLEFFNNIQRVGFYPDLEKVFLDKRTTLGSLLEKGQYGEILQALLQNPGLGYATKPKGLIPFHRYGQETRTPLAEHLSEASLLVRDEKGLCRLHFTLSPEQEESFKTHVAELKEKLEKKGLDRFEILFSRQKPSSDTLSLDESGKPLRDERGLLLFRPGGHGALIENLAEVRAPFLFIKNIDNVTIEPKAVEVVRWEKILGGYLVQSKAKADVWLRELSEPSVDPGRVEEIRSAVREQWGLEINLSKGVGKSPLERLRAFLDRPMRVCGVVPNSGDPGGGPFWVRSRDGTVSLQIVESSQVDMADGVQEDIFRRSTHFNPVDMVCATRDYTQKPFDLKRFIDPQAVFLSRKSWNGREIKALERPGLWNGAMAGWITFFIETPAETFHPVKTVFDLLKPTHVCQS